MLKTRSKRWTDASLTVVSSEFKWLVTDDRRHHSAVAVDEAVAVDATIVVVGKLRLVTKFQTIKLIFSILQADRVRVKLAVVVPTVVLASRTRTAAPEATVNHHVAKALVRREVQSVDRAVKHWVSVAQSLASGLKLISSFHSSPAHDERSATPRFHNIQRYNLFYFQFLKPQRNHWVAKLLRQTTERKKTFQNLDFPLICQ